MRVVPLAATSAQGATHIAVPDKDTFIPLKEPKHYLHLVVIENDSVEALARERLAERLWTEKNVGD